SVRSLSSSFVDPPLLVYSAPTSFQLSLIRFETIWEFDPLAFGADVRVFSTHAQRKTSGDALFEIEASSSGLQFWKYRMVDEVYVADITWLDQLPVVLDAECHGDKFVLFQSLKLDEALFVVRHLQNNCFRKRHRAFSEVSARDFLRRHNTETLQSILSIPGEVSLEGKFRNSKIQAERI